ncbi:hypothetical protein [Myroides injenensis]|uniref:hypothetical protein n=1 Tax=Myroides injenensis TaxID=1183151 RepID=UPI0002894D9F|nr:hypothetical protein [Myroides injenensis]
MKESTTKIKEKVLRKGEVISIFIWCFLSIASFLLYYFYPLFTLNEDQVLYIFSSAAQIVGALYGLIITGYIFLRTELDGKVDKDETYKEIIALMKTEYFRSIVIISIGAFVSGVLCFVIMGDESRKSGQLFNYLLNFSLPTIITTLIIIVLFVIKILNPRSLELASNKLRNITTKDSQNEKGSLEDFLRTYNKIEVILDKYGVSLLSFDVNNSNNAIKKRISRTKTVEILFKENKISQSLKNKLLKLISFRNSLIHGSNLVLSTSDVVSANEILEELESSLKI